MADIAGVCRKKQIRSVLIVTDVGIRSLGLTEYLEKSLTANHIAYCIYDRTVANPTIRNVEEARDMYLKHDAEAIIEFPTAWLMRCCCQRYSGIMEYLLNVVWPVWPGEPESQKKEQTATRRRSVLLHGLRK